MANYERRSADKDDGRVFDGGEDDGDGEGSHLPVVIIIAILVLAAFGGVVWLAYNQGVARGRTDVPVRVASSETNPGGQIKVYQQPAGGEDQETVPATNPMPRAQPASPEAETPAATVAQTTPPPAALTPVKPQPAPPPPAVATKPPAQLGIARPAPQRVAVIPATQQVAAKPAATTPKPVPPATLKPSTASGTASGGYALQVGAYKSQDEAMTAWKSYQAKHAALLTGFSPDVQRADLGPKGVWYRLRVTPFSDKAAASALCDRLKAENAACFLAR
jgi:cell division protein FtsN